MRYKFLSIGCLMLAWFVWATPQESQAGDFENFFVTVDLGGVQASYGNFERVGYWQGGQRYNYNQRNWRRPSYGSHGYGCNCCKAPRYRPNHIRYPRTYIPSRRPIYPMRNGFYSNRGHDSHYSRGDRNNRRNDHYSRGDRNNRRHEGPRNSRRHRR